MYMYAFACNSNMNRPVPCFHAVDVAFRLLLWTPNGSGLEGLYSTKVLIKGDNFYLTFWHLVSPSFSPSLYISLCLSLLYLHLPDNYVYILGFPNTLPVGCILYIGIIMSLFFPAHFKVFFIFIFRLTPTEKPGRGRKCLDLPHSNAK